MRQILKPPDPDKCRSSVSLVTELVLTQPKKKENKKENTNYAHPIPVTHLTRRPGGDDIAACYSIRVPSAGVGIAYDSPSD